MLYWDNLADSNSAKKKKVTHGQGVTIKCSEQVYQKLALFAHSLVPIWGNNYTETKQFIIGTDLKIYKVLVPPK